MEKDPLEERLKREAEESVKQALKEADEREKAAQKLLAMDICEFYEDFEDMERAIKRYEKRGKTGLAERTRKALEAWKKRS